MYSTLKVSLFKIHQGLFNRWFVAIASLMLIFISTEHLRAQELRISAGTQILGEINGAFTGFGIGFENRITDHFSLAGDLNLGLQKRGSAYEIRPAIHYFINRVQKGFYIGPSGKYIILKEKLDFNRFDDRLYAFGFSLGWKGVVNDHLLYNLNLSPHKTFGGRNESDVAGMSAQISIGYRF